MQEREKSILGVRELFERAGFLVVDAHGIRPSSFDLLARRDSQLVILKVLKNVDALAPEEGERIGELAELFQAAPLVICQTSGSARLEDGVIYTRYGLPILTEETASEFLLRGVPPFLLSSPGGIFARVDGVRLRRLREERRLSLGALASAAGVTRRTIQLYEDGGGAEITIVERIERYLQEPIVRPIPLFGPRIPGREPPVGPPPRPVPAPASREHAPPRTGDVLRDDVLRELDTMGWEVVVTARCPFDAFTHADEHGEEEILLTGIGSLRSALHRAEVLHGLARVIEGHSMFVTRDRTRRASIEGLPLLSLAELHRHRDPAELVELLHERGDS